MSTESSIQVSLSMAELNSSGLLPQLDFDAKEKATRLHKKVDRAIKNIEASLLYANVSRQLKNCVELRRNIVRVLGSNYTRLQMVIYGLGSLESCRNAKYQLAVALLLKRDFSYWFENILVFDPCFTSTDIIVLNELGCQVLFENERCLRKAVRPTLFFMPFIRFVLLGNLLGSNWCPTLINQMIILSIPLSYHLEPFDQVHFEGFKYQLELYYKVTYQVSNIKQKQMNEYWRLYMEGMRDIKGFSEAIEPFTKEFGIKQLPRGDKYYEVIREHAWHFFKVDPQVDMRTLLRGKIPKEIILEYFKTHELIPYDFSEASPARAEENEDGCAIRFRAWVKERKATRVHNTPLTKK